MSVDGLTEEDIQQLIHQYRSEQFWEDLLESARQTTKVVRRLSEIVVENDIVNTDSMTVLHRLCQHQKQYPTESKIRDVRNLDIPNENKDELEGEITDSVGSVGGTYFELQIPEEYEDATTELLRILVSESDRKVLDDAIDDFADLEISGIQSGMISPIFHYLHPTKYPIVNSRSRAGMEACFDKKVSRYLNEYLDVVSEFEEIRETYTFENHFRHLDYFFIWAEDEIEKLLQTQLFLAPCASNSPKKHFEETVANAVLPEKISEYAEEYQDDLRVWGVTEGKKSTWENIRPGDILLFYTGERTYQYAAEVRETEHNPEFAKRIWPDYHNQSAGSDDATDPYEYLIYLNQPIEIDIDSSILHSYAGHDQQYPLSFIPLNDRGLAKIVEEYGTVDVFLEQHKTPPKVWIEKTQIKNRSYKQEGSLELGKAILSPSKDKGGHRRYETLREANIGDIVVHLLQDQQQIVGASVIASELDEEFSGPPDDRWSEDQHQEGGYLRNLSDFEEFEIPIQIYEDILDNPSYKNKLENIREKSDKIFYDKHLSLNQGHYFTECPLPLVTILANESEHLAQFLQEKGVEVDDIRPSQPEVYESVASATEFIGEIIESDLTIKNPVESALSDLVLKEWTNALSKIDVQTEVDSHTGEILEEIKSVYTQIQPLLEEFATHHEIGTLHNLDTPETAYTVFVRLLQKEHLDLRPNANHVKFKTILHDEYRVTEDDSEVVAPHFLQTYLEDNSGSISVYKFTAPPDYWAFALHRRMLTFPAIREAEWEDLESGDLVLLYSQAEPSDDTLPTAPFGIIAAGIIGTSVERQGRWSSGRYEDDEYQYVASFDRLFVRGSIRSPVGVGPTSQHPLEVAVRSLTAEILSTRTINDRFIDAGLSEFPTQGVRAEFHLDSESDRQRVDILLELLADGLTEVSPINHQLDAEVSIPSSILDGLYFDNDRGEAILEDIQSALNAGKHIILTGPPGTGKTEIARRTAQHLATAYPHVYTGHQLTTATADWSTFDTVGGYMPTLDGDDVDHNELEFTPGIVLNRLKRNNRQRNEPIVIDELNRADIDKAFGQLFTLLSGQNVQLPYLIDGHEVELLQAEDNQREPANHEYIVPSSWRIFGTMNTYDKASLYEMSYAFMRRFAFVRVGPPVLPAIDSGRDDEVTDLMVTFADTWDLPTGELPLAEVGKIWQHANHAVEERSIGPAIIHDMLQFVEHHPNQDTEHVLSQAVVSYVFPQLEGVRNRKQIVNEIIRSGQVNEPYLRQEARDMLDVPLPDDQ